MINDKCLLVNEIQERGFRIEDSLILRNVTAKSGIDKNKQCIKI